MRVVYAECMNDAANYKSVILSLLTLANFAGDKL